MKNKGWFYIGLLLLLAGCFGSNKISNQNLQFLYDKGAGTLHPQFEVVNVKDSLS